MNKYLSDDSISLPEQMKKDEQECKELPEKFRISHLQSLLVDTFNAWINKDPFRLSAVVAYYAILSLPALLILIFDIVGGVWGREIVQGELFGEISAAMGPDTATSIQSMVVKKGNSPTSMVATVLGIITLVYGATGVFYQLQNALDDIWEVGSKYSNGIIATLFGRLKSFGFILIFGFLLLISFVLTSMLSAFSNRLKEFLPDFLIDLAFILDIILSLLFIYFLFAAMFKYLPSKSIEWKAVKYGAALTAILFVIGKYILAFYFGQAEPGSTYGAAGSIILIMLWVSYSSLILFFGAQFTKIYSDRYISVKDSLL